MTAHLEPALSDHVLVLDPPLRGELAEELARRVYFAAAEIRDFQLVVVAGLVTAVRVTVSGAVPPEVLADKLNSLVRDEVAPQLVREPKVVWRSATHREPPAGMFDRLVAAGVAYPVGEGQVALGEPLLGLMDDLDRVLRAIVVEEYGGTEYRYPTLIPVGVLERCGYLTSFPQHAMFATRLRSDVDVYREFAADAATGPGIGDRVLDRCAGVDHCLPPTMCYHTFNQFGGAVLPAELSVFTARGKSFRHEARYHRTLARLWDFTIREIVFLGTREQVLDARERFLARITALAGDLGVSGRCEVANDPFFGNADSGAQASSQRLLELKYELQLDLAPDDAVAVGSFNFHERRFGEAFDISLAGSTGAAFSACAGFGLERFAFALVCQHGPDLATWAPAVRRALADPRKGSSS
ncbi:hypothetical protein [Actinophytocola sp.]|uniref:hypothetical protein n=1 Tax=Actinophytocola sp. TaxID=1872138 RepID=UPI00389A080E